jgi:hypothetical protein
LQLFGKSQEFCWGFTLQFLEVHGDLRRGWGEDRPSKGTPAQSDSSKLGRAGIVWEKREEPITGAAIPLAKRDMQVKHNYKTPGITAKPPFGSERLNDDEEHDANHC